MSATHTDTAPAITPVPTRGAAARLGNVVRMHLANPMTTLVLPWLITFAVFGLNAAIWAIVASAAGGAQNLDENAFTTNGGISWILFFFTVVAVQAMNLTFHFALGFTVTRRDFYLGSVLFFVLLALVYATGITGLAAIERATDGWGMGGAFFAPFFLIDAPLITVWYAFVALMMLFFFVGAVVATIWVRWKAYGLYAFFIALAALLVIAVWGITASQSWPAVGRFFVDTSIPVLLTWTFPVTALCGVLGLIVLRKATTRS